MEDESHGILHYVRDAPALVVISVHSPVDSLMAWWSSSCFTGNCFSLRLVPQDVWCCCFCWASVFSLFFWRRTHRKTDTKSPYNNLIQWQQRLKEKGGGSQVMRIFLTEWVWSMTAEVQQTQYKSLPVTDCCFSRVFFFTDRDWERNNKKIEKITDISCPFSCMMSSTKIMIIKQRGVSDEVLYHFKFRGSSDTN